MIVKAQFKAWPWKFQRQKAYNIPFDVGTKPMTILSSSGKPLVIARGFSVIIKRHYHFDGATWAPDFKKVLPSAALHDALLQLKDKYPNRLNEEVIYQAFDRQMEIDGFKGRWLYSFFTRPFFRKIYKRISA